MRLHLHQVGYGPGVKLCGCALHKANKPVQTRVGKYVEEHQGKVSSKIAKLLKRAGKDIAQKVAAKLGKVDSTDAVVQALLAELDLEDIAVDVVDAISPELIKAFQEAGLFGLEQANIAISAEWKDNVNQAALDYADEHGGELITDLAGTTEEDLRATITDAIETGMSTDELASAIEDLGAFGDYRAEMIARTELANASVQGNVAGWKETGQVEGKRSILGDLHDIMDECDDCADAGVVPVDDEFVPGYDFPPYHPSCVCDVLPVLISDQSDNSDDQSDQGEE